MSRLKSSFRFPIAGALSGSLAVRLAGAGAAFGLNALLARLAGAEQYGAYSYVLTWMGVGAMVVTLGLDVSLVKHVAAYHARAEWPLLTGLIRWSHRRVLTLACLLGLVVGLLVTSLESRLGASLTPTIRLGCGALPILALLRLSEARLVGLGRVVLAQLPDAVLRPIVTAVMAALVFWVPGTSLRGSDAMGLHLIALAIAATTALALLRRAGPSDSIEADYDPSAWWRVSLPLWLEAGTQLVSASLDVILIGSLVGVTEAGIYAVAKRLAELIAFGIHASQAAARPHIATAHARGDHQTMQRAVTAAALWATVFAIVISCSLLPTRAFLLQQFGQEFVRGSTVILILSVGYFVTACTAVVHAVMNMTDYQRTNMRISAVMLGIKLPLSLAAIAHGGMVGAALVSSGVMVVGCLWAWHHVRRTLGIDGTILGLATSLRS